MRHSVILLALLVACDTQGPEGPQGEPGIQGPPGVEGPRGEAWDPVDVYPVIVTNVPPIDAWCNVGDRFLFGGCDMGLVSPTAWGAQVDEETGLPVGQFCDGVGAEGDEVTATAWCASRDE